MSVIIVGNVLKDVYLDLDSRVENFETDKNGTKWLDLAFNASEHHFFNRNSNFGGAAISLEVLQKIGIPATISDSDFNISEDNPTLSSPPSVYRYILIADNKVTYFAPSKFKTTIFSPPAEAADYLYVDRSAEIDASTAKKINAYLDISPHTKLVLYIRNFNNQNLNSLLSRADLLFIENTTSTSTPELTKIPPEKIVSISEKHFSYLNITENISTENIDVLTHLSAYSIASATILGCFISGFSVEDSLKIARVNTEYSKLNSALPLSELQKIADSLTPNNELELVAANLMLKNKGILAADESGGSIKKKFAQLDIPDTYENRRDYRNIFFTTPDLEKYINGIILFDETAHQLADNGQNFVDFLTGRRIIPGIKVDQGLEKFADSSSANHQPNPEETWTKGLDGLNYRLKEYYLMGLRFAKWRAAFEIRLDEQGNLLTPTDYAIDKNCQILAEYARKCQNAQIVPIVEPELVYDGYYDINQSATITGKILDQLFRQLTNHKVNLSACILKVNMILAGKKYEVQSTPKEVGIKTADVLKAHVPKNLAGIVFLSGGQTAEQATNNLAAITAQGPFPWPVTFSFARALQDPALYTWKGNKENTNAAREAFHDRLVANAAALNNSKEA